METNLAPKGTGVAVGLAWFAGELDFEERDSKVSGVLASNGDVLAATSKDIKSGGVICAK
jgi:hypothetical protein